jgi:hypothetical protein
MIDQVVGKLFPKVSESKWQIHFKNSSMYCERWKIQMCVKWIIKGEHDTHKTKRIEIITEESKIQTTESSAKSIIYSKEDQIGILSSVITKIHSKSTKNTHDKIASLLTYITFCIQTSPSLYFTTFSSTLSVSIQPSLTETYFLTSSLILALASTPQETRPPSFLITFTISPIHDSQVNNTSSEQVFYVEVRKQGRKGRVVQKKWWVHKEQGEGVMTWRVGKWGIRVIGVSEMGKRVLEGANEVGMGMEAKVREEVKKEVERRWEKWEDIK